MAVHRVQPKILCQPRKPNHIPNKKPQHKPNHNIVLA